MLLLLVLLVPATSGADAVVKQPTLGTDGKPLGDFIEDVNAKQLERMLDEKDYVAVFWCRSHFLLLLVRFPLSLLLLLLLLLPLLLLPLLLLPLLLLSLFLDLLLLLSSSSWHFHSACD